MATIPKRADAPAPDTSSHGIAIEFPDDHSIDGIKMRILGVTPEQIAVAIWNLERVANAAADYRLQQQQAAQAPKLDTAGGRGDVDIAKIMRDPRGGLRD